jgi:uncharacterized protein (TIGR00730 family)
MTGSGAPDKPAPDCDENTAKIIEQTLFGLWSAANELARVRFPSDRFRVTIFGSARVQRGDPTYGEVVRLARRLAEIGCDIVTGGGPGLMQAANEGEQLGDPDGKTRSLGIRVHLPFEQDANPFVEKIYAHRTFFTRLHHFVRVSDAFVVVPGGIGTALELLMVWQLLQVKHVSGVPLILVGTMWQELVEWARRHMVEGELQMASGGDIEIPHCVQTGDVAADIIEAVLESRRSLRSQ